MTDWKAKQKSKISVSPPAWREQAKKEAINYLEGKQSIFTFKEDLREKTKDFFERAIINKVLDITLGVAQKEIEDWEAEFWACCDFFSG